VYNYGGGILENCDSPRYMIHHVAGYVTRTHAHNRLAAHGHAEPMLTVRQ
jgi:hypothetical protein